jgi:hypothetical protein
MENQQRHDAEAQRQRERRMHQFSGPPAGQIQPLQYRLDAHGR